MQGDENPSILRRDDHHPRCCRRDGFVFQPGRDVVLVQGSSFSLLLFIPVSLIGDCYGESFWNCDITVNWVDDGRFLIAE